VHVIVASATPILGEALAQALTAAGHDPLHASSNAELRRLLAGEPKPSAAFVARRLPGGDALDVRDAADGVPLVLVSPDERDRDAARAARLAGFLHVPFQPGEVLRALGVSTRDKRVVLLADDSDLVHRHTAPILEEAGYTVVHAYDGDQALALLDDARPDLVITDVEMPGKDGYQVCAAIKGEPDTSHLPVIICSSLGEATDLERGFDVGADDYIVKPVIPEEMLSRVRDLLAEVDLSGRERLLVVDDSPAIRHLVGDALTRQGFEVTTASDGQEGLERAVSAEKPYELILTDYDMPRMTGFEMVHALKREQQTRDTPVLMLTARDTRRDRAQMRAAGLTAYLVKPFSADKCVAMVERMLAERRLRGYKEASKLYISDGARKAAEAQASAGAMFSYRASHEEMTVLFSDICGFTSMSSAMPAPDVVQLLNGYFDAMCPVVKARGGDIDKFIGDAIMAIFTDDAAFDEPHTLRAVRAAWEMQRALDAFNAAIGRDPPLQMRVGVNTGPAVRGDIGSRYVRRDYNVIGDTVNRAQRYESNAPKGGVLISAELYELVKDGVDVEPLEGLKLKGIDRPVTAYVVKGFVGEDW
jgi:DNA-binding response OmpR family regulator